MKDIKKYVFATEDDLNDGCGVLVGDLFVTAGHVVDERPFRTTIDGKEYAFYKKDAILYHWNEAESRDANSIDIAVFKVEGAHSPLTFADFSPAVGDSLRSISLEHKEGEYAHEGDVSLIPEIFRHTTYTYYDINDCKAEVTELEGNYIACNTDVILKPGSSGSPLLCGDKVVGILHSGKVGTNLCAFLSAKVILEDLNQM